MDTNVNEQTNHHSINVKNFHNKMSMMHQDMVNMKNLYQKRLDIMLSENQQAKQKYRNLKTNMEQNEQKSQSMIKELQMANEQKFELETQLKYNNETIDELLNQIEQLELELEEKEQKVTDDIHEDNNTRSLTTVSNNDKNEQNMIQQTSNIDEIQEIDNVEDMLNKMMVRIKDKLNVLVNVSLLKQDIPTKIRENCLSLTEKAQISSFKVPYTTIMLSKDSKRCDIDQAAIQLAFEGTSRPTTKLNVWTQITNEKLVDTELNCVTEIECKVIVDKEVDRILSDIKRSML